MTKSYVWPWVNRLSHLLLIVFLATAYLIGDYKKLADYHVAFGYALGVVFVFRIIWGFVGPRYSKFKDFNFNLADLKAYLLSPFRKGKPYIGHNPASSYAIIGMILLTFLTIVFGVLTQGIEKNHGILSLLHNAYFEHMELFSHLHEFFANALIALIGIHIAGTLIDKFIKKGDAIDAMVNGYKKTKTHVSVRLNIWQKLFAILWIGVSLFTLYYMLATKDNMWIASANIKQDYAQLHQDFSKECGSCHITYPPFLLPKSSWVSMMEHLDNHFGEDASLDEISKNSIMAFLSQNSAEHSTQEAAFKILKSMEQNSTIIAITETPYWKHRHRKIKKEVFASAEVKSKANCKACHSGIQNGIIEDNRIHIPRSEG
ncbi:cytochrome b/b6 domain-containing protein [Sulfurospirillum sp. 1612]|uniref:cytochrome b/b6 domain-containing protein n=1 Tax=Sulfurospirillum sp. 1612 TaxID=3094835 RepID=UPI002F9566BF